MARAIWTGTISFGLVTVPVKLYSAINRKTVRFHQLSGKTGVRVAQMRVDPQSNEEVPYESIVKGYELAPDRYVVIEPGELDALQPEKTRTIEIEDFVELSQIDPIFYDHPYYLAPGPGGAKPYRLLLEAMRETGKVAIARVVIRNKELLVAIRPMGDVLVMSTMLFADEVLPPDRLEELSDGTRWLVSNVMAIPLLPRWRILGTVVAEWPRLRDSPHPFPEYSAALNAQNAGVRRALAQKFELSSDGLTLTYTLRDNLVWSNGDPFTGDDYKYTAEAVMRSKKTVRKSTFDNVDGAKDYGDGKTDSISGIQVSNGGKTITIIVPIGPGGAFKAP